MSKAIKITGLTFGYEAKIDVIKDVSLSIDAGSYVTIIGHNGSGKSTLAKIMVGLLETKHGTIEIFGTTLSANTVHRLRRQLGIVFQNPDNQFIGATVADDIAFGLENREIPQKEMDPVIDSVLEEVNMIAFKDKEPANLSGGQKQRVAIAGVLAMKPDIIIFDEATAMLDPQGKKEIRDLIRRMKKENPKLTLISITHDVEEAFLSDEVIVMNEGRIIAIGTPEEVFSHEKELNAIRLEQPFIYKLKKALASEGIQVPEKVKTSDELTEFLCQ
ncbi:MAG: energy-coupling factor transporter ATPase [Bacilli bacterium]